MTNDTDRNQFEALAKLLKTELNFNDFLNSMEFKRANFEDTDLAHHLLRGKVFTVVGDIRSINITAYNCVQLMLTISNEFNGVSSSTEVVVYVPDHLRDEVLSLKTDTGIYLRAKYIKFNVVVDTFELLGIKSTSNDLNFPYFVCSGDNKNPEAYADFCHRVFGYTEESRSDFCPICGSRIKSYNNIYDSDFFGHIKHKG